MHRGFGCYGDFEASTRIPWSNVFAGWHSRTPAAAGVGFGGLGFRV